MSSNLKILKKFIKEEIGRNYKSVDQVGNISIEKVLEDYINCDIITDQNEGNHILMIKIKGLENIKDLNDYRNINLSFHDYNMTIQRQNQILEKIKSILYKHDIT